MAILIAANQLEKGCRFAAYRYNLNLLFSIIHYITGVSEKSSLNQFAASLISTGKA